VLQELIEALPIVTASLASPIKPFEQNPHSLLEKLSQTGIVPNYPVVVVIPSELGIQLPEQHVKSQVPILLTPGGEVLQRVSQLLARGAALEVRSSPSVLPPAKLKP
jgi:hypothetical protein